MQHFHVKGCLPQPPKVVDPRRKPRPSLCARDDSRNQRRKQTASRGAMRPRHEMRASSCLCRILHTYLMRRGAVGPTCPQERCKLPQSSSINPYNCITTSAKNQNSSQLQDVYKAVIILTLQFVFWGGLNDVLDARDVTSGGALSLHGRSVCSETNIQYTMTMVYPRHVCPGSFGFDQTIPQPPYSNCQGTLLWVFLVPRPTHVPFSLDPSS